MKPYQKIINLLIVALMLAGLSYSSAKAQYFFGKNKVQYTNFDWQVMETDHFKIYFYTEENEVAAIAARSAEDAYRALAAKFNHEIKRKVPLIIYSAPGYFSQTNVIPSMLPESVAGFTEFMKGRVVVPFHGSYYDFDHVIRHELVHVFTLSKLKEVTARRSRLKYSYPPLWFTEGLAEYWSKEWDSEADMIVKDMVLNDRLFTIPNMYQIRGTFFMYKLGESICHFIDSTYGADKLSLIFENWHKSKYFDKVVEYTLGDDLKELSRKWTYYLKKKYYPDLADHGLPDMESDKITIDGYNVKGVPISWDDGDGKKEWLVYKANRLGYSGIYMTPLESRRKKIKTIIKGERSTEFESLYLLRSGIDANDDGLIIFSSKSKENDIIYLYDLKKKKIVDRFKFDDLVAARSPRLSNDSRRAVFYGVKKSGFTDLYLLDLSDGSYEKITDDIYYDVDAVFSLDDSRIIYSSDRSDVGRFGYMNLFSVDLNSREIKQLTFGAYRDHSPEPTDNGIYFSSDRNKGFNIYSLNDDGKLSVQSTYATGALDPRLTSDGKSLVYTGYQKMGFHIYTMDMPDDPPAIDQPAIASSGTWQPAVIPGKYRQTSIKYDTDYSFDIAQSSIGYDPVYGSIGGFQGAVSDVLGNHSIYFLLFNTAQTKDEMLESFNFGATYIKKEDRLNWGVGAFHLYDEYFNDHHDFFFERQAGGISLLSYPISKFSRFDFTTLLRYSKRDRILGLNIWEKFLATNYISWIYDNSLWDMTGPLEGRRYNISFGVTSSLTDKANWNRLMSIDLRHYLRLGRVSAFANRMFVYSSSGREPQRIYFGGSWSFRGYDRREFYNRNIIFSSNELRFPLINHFIVGSPIGGLGLRGIRGALFFDVGSAWDDDYDKLLGSFGTGFRVTLGYLVVLRFDFSRRTDFHSISDRTDFDFFFGWNF